MQTKAVFFDIDGTLINIMEGRPQMTEPVRRAVRHLHEAGHHTFIASGRPFAYLDPELTQGGDFDGFVLMNGALVLCGGRQVFAAPLPRQTVKDIVALTEQCGVEYILEGAETVYLHPEFSQMFEFCHSIDIDTRPFVREFSLDEIDVYKLEFISREENGNGLFHRLLAWPGMTGLMDPYHKKNLELYAKSVTKGSGILHALDALGIPRQNSFAFGDGLNDIEMMQTVGTGIAMGNAQPEVKRIAGDVVPSVDEDGVAWGIEHIILED